MKVKFKYNRDRSVQLIMTPGDFFIGDHKANCKGIGRRADGIEKWDESSVHLPDRITFCGGINPTVVILHRGTK